MASPGGAVPEPAGGDIWVIDTSSIIQIRRLQAASDRKVAIYRDLAVLVGQGRLLFPTEVFRELKDGHDHMKEDSADPGFDWVTSVRDQATRFGTDFEMVPSVLKQVPDVLDHEKTTGPDEADPYVLSLALVMKGKGYDATVVTEERKDRPDKMSINTACGLLRLYCVPLQAFLRDTRIWMPSG